MQTEVGVTSYTGSLIYSRWIGAIPLGKHEQLTYEDHLQVTETSKPHDSHDDGERAACNDCGSTSLLCIPHDVRHEVQNTEDDG